MIPALVSRLSTSASAQPVFPLIAEESLRFGSKVCSLCNHLVAFSMGDLAMYDNTGRGFRFRRGVLFDAAFFLPLASLAMVVLATGCFFVTAFLLEAFLPVTVDFVLTVFVPVFRPTAFFLTGLTVVWPVSAERILVGLAMAHLHARGYENEQLTQHLQISNQFNQLL